ncbi:MAG: carboxypeptidase-like regulatory domain-containing protein [Methanoregula sp.]|nr:carboxypeptidase-like regulatory domain-containing protein [Methanoregula sp.]
MNQKIRYTVLIVLTIGILLILALTTSSPLLYSLEKDIFPSPFHENIDQLKLQSLNSTTDIDPQLQEFIDISSPISLNIRIHDVEQARRDLERFGKNQGSMKNLIIKLDMNESEIQEIERNTALQKEILESLLNTSVSLDSLQSMEIQYHDQNNEDMLTTVRLRGNELRKKVRGINERYRNATEKVVAASTILGLDVTQNLASQKEVEQIIQEIEKPDTTTHLAVDTILIPGEDRISLFIRPAEGKYRESIEYQGISLTLKGNTTLRTDGKPITLYLDDIPFSSLVTDTYGYYNIRLPIERISSGIHTIYARSPTSRSLNRTLTAIPVNSVTNLTVSKPDSEGRVNCSGFVMANFPVRSASVQITWDQTHIIVTKTDANGQYLREIQLPPGHHTLTAGFSGEGYPINSSESEPQNVEISFIRGVETDYGQLLSAIAVMGVCIFFTGATAVYIRRISRRKSPLSGIHSDTEGDAQFPLIDSDSQISEPGKNLNADSTESGDETLIASYTRILIEQGLSAASRCAYQQLAERIAHDLRIKRHTTLTAREMGQNCRKKPYYGAFARFISAYEHIRYGGQISVKDQSMLETAIYTSDEQIGGGKY